MFVSFFPRPRWFFVSAVAWAALMVGLWFAGARAWGAAIGLPPLARGTSAPVGAQVFWSAPFLWFYLYYWAATALFYAVWRVLAPHPWARWSILGSALILFATYLQVQVSVAVNAWYGPFWDLVQAAVSHTKVVTQRELFLGLVIFLQIALVGVTLGAFATRFFVNHYIFRWRAAMNDYFMAHWPTLRRIEGAAQRVQEDTMRFSTIMESLGVKLVDAVMSLLAFMPVLLALSVHVKRLPLIGQVPYALVWASLAWSVLGTGFLAAIGVRLPGLQFANQRVEAAYRKELVYGEDDPGRARPATVRALFADVRKNYFRLYFNYLFFYVGLEVFGQTDVIFPLVLLIPSIAAATVTFGLINQILNALDKVRASFQYLATSWTSIIEMLSIFKRLRAFEGTIGDAPPVAPTDPAAVSAA